MRELAMSRPRSPATWESYGYTGANLVHLHTKKCNLGDQQIISLGVTTPLFLNRPDTNNRTSVSSSANVVVEVADQADVEGRTLALLHRVLLQL